MATIEKRKTKAGKVRYRVKVRMLGLTEQATFVRKTDADHWAVKIEADMAARRHFGASKRHTLAELLDRYEESELQKLKSKDDVKAKLQWWRGELGKILLSDLKPDVIGKSRDKLRELPKLRGGGKRSAADVNRTLAALSSACTYAVKELSWLESNPLSKVSKGTENKGRVRFLSTDELPRLLEACRQSTNKSLYLAVVLSLTTGARQSEVMGLRQRDINLKARTATLGDTKNGDARTLPLSSEAVTMLLERFKVVSLTDDRLFPPKPKPGTKSPFLDLRAPFAAALEVAGLGTYEGEGKDRKFIADFRWHDLRHTAASYMAMNGTSPLQISKILGHRTMAMVARYSHLSPDNVVEIGDRLSASMGMGAQT